MLKKLGNVLVGLMLSTAAWSQVGGPGTVVVGGGGGGSGNVVGPSSSRDNVIVRFDSTTGKIIQETNLTCSDVSGVTTTIATITPTATTGASVAGQSIAFTASPAVASTDTAGAAAGGSVTITAGAAARNTSGNANGGDINLVTGAGIGTGTAGQVLIPPGANQKPSLAFSDDKNTGFSGNAGDYIVVNNGGLVRGWLSTPEWHIESDMSYEIGTDTGLARPAAGVLKVTDGSTGIRGFLGGGAAVASATALPLPTGRVFHVTGTTDITSITSTNFQSGVCVTLIFDGVLNFTDGSNLKLASTMATTADDTISLCYDGTSWFETSRSVN